jgi:hypothetical protein
VSTDCPAEAAQQWRHEVRRRCEEPSLATQPPPGDDPNAEQPLGGVVDAMMDPELAIPASATTGAAPRRRVWRLLQPAAAVREALGAYAGELALHVALGDGTDVRAVRRRQCELLNAGEDMYAEDEDDDGE